MTDLSVIIGDRNGDSRREIIFRYGGKEYPDTFDPYSGFQRDKSLERALRALGLNPEENISALSTEIVRLAKAKDETDEYRIGKPFLIRLDTVEPENIEWLWKNKIAKGKLNELVGDPGLGKSLVVLDWAARITTGADWPDGTPNNRPGSVVLLSFEDDVADTIRPRLDAAGADVSRIALLQGVSWYDADAKTETVRSFELQRDILALEEAIEKTPDCQLVAIDPITACLGKVDSHKNADVRAVLSPLIELAQRRGVAVLGISHLNKSSGQAMYRTMGSLAFVAAARSVWVVTKDKENPSVRFVLPIKNNLAPDVAGMSYSIVEVAGQPVLAWGNRSITMSADEALAPEPSSASSARAKKRQEVETWLRDLLSAGPMEADQVHGAAKGAGHSLYAIRAAKENLGIAPYREGFGPGAVWYWKLPSIGCETNTF